jgi:hypothetical protein
LNGRKYPRGAQVLQPPAGVAAALDETRAPAK